MNEKRSRVKEKKQNGSKRVKYKERGENKGKTGLAKVGKISVSDGEKEKNMGFHSNICVNPWNKISRTVFLTHHWHLPCQKKKNCWQPVEKSTAQFVPGISAPS